MKKGKIRWGAVVNAVVGVVAALGDPAVLAYLPHKVATGVTIATIVIGAYKKSAVREEHERVSR